MANHDILPRIRIASPCPARWDDMEGNDGARSCGLCEKNVYNFSGMTALEVERLVKEKEGNLCGRFYRRADGTILTADCPVGVRLWWQRARRALARGVAMVLFALSSLTCGLLVARAARQSDDAQQTPIDTAIHKSIDDVKNLLGFKPPEPEPTFIMGDICIEPTPVKVQNSTGAK